MTDEPVPVAAARVVSPYNPANILTVVRIVLVPVFLALVVASSLHGTGPRIVSCLVFCVASGTDFLDGWIARRWSMVTSFGKVADPIADKALTGTALVLLAAYGRVWWWVVIVILAREWGVTALRFWVIRYGIIPASRGGKAKTLVQTVAIGLYVLPLVELTGGSAVVEPVRVAVMAVAIALTVITGFDYILRAARLRSTSTAA